MNVVPRDISATIATEVAAGWSSRPVNAKRKWPIRYESIELLAICADLAGKSVEDRALVGCIGRERADLVIAGCAILEAILDVWPAPRIGVADRGIREGILRALMASQGE